MFMDINEQFLGMLQISDSLFPIGSFTSSNGLEYLAVHGSSKDDIYEFICNCITQQIGPTDCVGFGNAYDSVLNDNLDEILYIDQIIYATKTAKEIRDSAVRSGSQMIHCIIKFANNDTLNRYNTSISNNLTPGTLVVASAVSAFTIGITKQQGMTCFVYSAVASMISALLRMGTIDHFEGQQMIHNTKNIISHTISKYIDTPLSDMWQFTPQCDIVQMSHERIKSRMFNA